MAVLFVTCVRIHRAPVVGDHRQQLVGEPTPSPVFRIVYIVVACVRPVARAS
jgi:hypothetical protein